MQDTSAEIFVAAVDSSHAETSQFSRQFDSNCIADLNLNRSNQFRNPNFDRNAFSPDSTFPRMTIFVPDATLTASTPIFKPAPLDLGIFIPGGECSDPKFKN